MEWFVTIAPVVAVLSVAGSDHLRAATLHGSAGARQKLCVSALRRVGLAALAAHALIVAVAVTAPDLLR